MFFHIVEPATLTHTPNTGGYPVQSAANLTSLDFNCSATLDPKTTNHEINFVTNGTDGDVVLNVNNRDYGVDVSIERCLGGIDIGEKSLNRLCRNFLWP